MRGKRQPLVLGLAVAIVVIGGLSVYLARDALRERWWIHRLASPDAEVRASVARQLGAVGRERAARALVDGLVNGGTPGTEAVEALQVIFGRVGAETGITLGMYYVELR